MLFMIYAVYSVDPSSMVLFCAEDLREVTLHNDNLVDFLGKWDATLIHIMDRAPPQETKEAYFVKETTVSVRLR